MSGCNNVRIQMRRMDISGEEFFTYFEEHDWDYLMEIVDDFDRADTRVLELWMLCREDNDSTDERACVWP